MKREKEKYRNKNAKKEELNRERTETSSYTSIRVTHFDVC
jgi:hypothetical protein